ncbi:hypothetical protein PILCRDRAFT_815410 [Piloderma croceum F 1598]|uniref:Uncharacterized protein n=1 Tax=Piloderma croceum (strain F 1598) TaxID=765440 RepID=A0A0C3FS77_PILCF|nr:hypothetical protein PILCRDRAFT_815410 [Piloderma croceum F 1598]
MESDDTLPDTPIEPSSPPLGEGSSETSQRLRPRVTRSTAASAPTTTTDNTLNICISCGE